MQTNFTTFLRALWHRDQFPITKILLLFAVAAGFALGGSQAAVFSVKDYGATGQKSQDARPAIQKAIEVCAAVGGGVVLLPGGEYTSGTLHLRSHVHFRLAAGATLYASRDPKAYYWGDSPSKAALLYGEDLDDVSLDGLGNVDGQAEYEWVIDDFERAFEHKTIMQNLGKSLLRSVPVGFPKQEIFPKLMWLGHSKNIRVSGLNFLHSPSWSLTLFGCDRAVFEGLYIYSSLKEAVWADGIDLDGCKGVTISGCTIETGDDCVALSSQNGWGPARVCEDICVTNCRLSTASAGLKFSEGNRAGIRNIRVVNTLFNNVNRGVAFNVAMGGYIRDVTFLNLTINCSRCDWFWAGEGQPFRFRVARWSEFDQRPPEPGEPPVGAVRNITIRNVIARAKGSSLFYGHPESWLDGVTLDNVQLSMGTDPGAPFDKAEHALDFRHVKNLKLKNVAVTWEKPGLAGWKSALNFEDVNGLVLEGFSGRQAWPQGAAPAIALQQVADAVVSKCRALEDTGVFLDIAGTGSRGIRVQENDVAKAKVPWQLDKDLPRGAVRITGQ